MSTSARRVLRIQKILKGRSLTGLSNGEIAKALDDSPANICRALTVMEDEGMVRRLETGRWALTAHAHEMELAQDRIQELNRRILSGSKN
jgi:DNA-binding IclR family transcriptional regulator